MKCLFISGENPYAEHTGYYKASRDYLDIFLGKANVEVTLLSLNSKKAIYGPPRDLVLRSCNAGRRIPKRISQMGSLLFRSTATESQFKRRTVCNAVISIIRELQPALVVFNGIRAGWILRYVSRARFPRIIYIAHNPESASLLCSADHEANVLLRWAIRREAKKMERLEDRILMGSSGLVVQTEEDADRLLQIRGVLPKYLVLPPRHDMPKPSEARDDHRRKEILLVGSFKWLPKRRDAKWLIERVMPLVRSEIADVTLSIVGSGAEWLRPHLVEGVNLFPNVPSTLPYYAGKPVFVVVDRQLGGIKNKTVEAAAHSLAIVATPEGIEGTGLIGGESCSVATHAEDFAAAIVRYLQNPVLYDGVSHKAREIVSEKFDKVINQHRFSTFCDQILA